MSIEFHIDEPVLKLEYTPSYGPVDEDFKRRLMSDEGYSSKNTFYLSDSSYRDNYENDFGELTFCYEAGLIDGDYVVLNKNLFGTEHTFFFDKSIAFTEKLFVATQNVSILRKIDEIVNDDVYIGGDWEGHKNGMPIEEYRKLIKVFPNSTEIKKYVHSRIALLTSDYFEEKACTESKYQNYLHKKETRLKKEASNKKFEADAKVIQKELFESSIERLEYMLEKMPNASETAWQEEVNTIVRILYPQYIYSRREVKINGIGKNDKKPDFLLIDSSGFADVLEIKKPDAKLLGNSKVRNNYVPHRELSNTVQQIEKYIVCLSRWGEIGENVLTNRYKNELPNGLRIRIVSPRGMLLLGRSNNLNNQQKIDLDIIKRQYKNIVDIMTYDDLIFRLKNIVDQLEK